MAWGYPETDPIEIVSGSGGGGRDDGQPGFAPNLAHTETQLREQLKEWMLWLKHDIGFDGWRYDMVKGFAPSHIGEYNYHTKSYLTVGEYWDNNTQLIYDWIDQTDAFHVSQKSMAFDFPLQSHLRDIFWGSKPFDQLGMLKYSSVSLLQQATPPDIVVSTPSRFTYSHSRLGCLALGLGGFGKGPSRHELHQENERKQYSSHDISPSRVMFLIHGKSKDLDQGMGEKQILRNRPDEAQADSVNLLPAHGIGLASRI